MKKIVICILVTLFLAGCTISGFSLKADKATTDKGAGITQEK